MCLKKQQHPLPIAFVTLALNLAISFCVLFIDACRPFGANSTAPATVRILMYHHIGDFITNRWWVPAADFEEQLEFLREQGYASVLPADIAAYRAGLRKIPKRAVLLSFDDGGKDLLDTAAPLLNKYGFTGVVYLITGFVAKEDEPRGVYEGAPCLMWKEVRALAESGIMAFGGHTRTSPDLRRFRNRDFEIAGCRKDILENTGIAVDSFCYPFGRYDTGTIAAVAAAGFTMALTCEQDVAMLGPDIRLLELPRIHVVGGECLEDFKRRLLFGR